MGFKSGPGDFTNIMSLKSIKLECVIHFIFNLCRFYNIALYIYIFIWYLYVFYLQSADIIHLLNYLLIYLHLDCLSHLEFIIVTK